MSCGIKRILTIQTPIKYSIIRILGDHSVDITTQCSYSWSTDSVCWTNWVDYSTYTKIGPNIDGDYYLRILLLGGLTGVYLDNTLIDCYNICLAQSNPYIEDPCVNAVDLYSNLDCALQMQQQLADLVCCMIGIPCYYFRVSPIEDSRDLTFKEYILHGITDMKYIKLVCEEGALPSSKPQMTEFDFDWDNDWEVEVGKSMFAQAFGDTASPKQRDIIYVPMMKRMYEVNAAYDEKQEMLMWRATTWKLALVKWNDKTNVDQNDYESIIDDWIVNRADDILVSERNEQERLSSTTQLQDTYSPDNITRHAVDNDMVDLSLTDSIRRYISKQDSSNIADRVINHGSIIVAHNMYNFKNPSSKVVYQKTWCGGSGVFMMIIDWDETSTMDYDLLRLGDVVLRAQQDTVIFGDLSCKLRSGLYMIICRWNRASFSQELSIYAYTSDMIDKLPQYRIRPDMWKFDFNNPLYSSTSAYNNDYDIRKPVTIELVPGSCSVTNVKLYDCALDDQSIYKESLKYVTKNEHCVLNDVAHKIETPYGWSPR